MFCACCDVVDFCRNIKSRLASDSELSDPEFIRDVRDFAYSLNISSYQWREYLNNLYRDYRGWIEGTDGLEVFLNMRVFEIENHRAWFRDFCCTPTKDHIKPYVRKEARGRVQILATILRAAYPDKTMMWGVRPANDNKAA
jgi:hypothetical protein